MKSVSMLLSAAVLAILAGGCTSMPDDKVAGLPELTVNEHVVEPGDVFGHCKDAMSWWHWATLSFPLACARIDFDKKTCDIYVATNSPPETVEHERRHCQGYDHGGRIQDAYNAWLENEPTAAGPLGAGPAGAAGKAAATALTPSGQ